MASNDNGGKAAPRKTRVAILGGGPGGIATAFWLTATPELRAKFDVDIYTPGWRLGGKCASGRDEGRIEEHGLHLLMGCYRNAFATICACYDEWKPRLNGAFQKFGDAFAPQYQITLPERDDSGKWRMWNFVMKPRGANPCDGASLPENSEAQDFAELSALMIEMSHGVQSIALQLTPWHSGEIGTTMQNFRATAGSSAFDPEQVNKLVKDLVKLKNSIVRKPSDIEAEMPAPATAPTGLDRGTICPSACKRTLVELGIVVMAGWLMDVLLGGSGAIDKLNEVEFRAWLKKWGASDAAAGSAPIRALYNLTFAFPDGDASNIDNGSIACGVTLRFMMSACFGYKGAPLWKMNAGMGDTVFMPLYQVLLARKVVRFHFFHRLESMSLGKDGKIAAITLNQQAQTIGAEYKPVADVARLDCWPAKPFWGQLVDGEILENGNVDFESPDEPTTVRAVPLAVGSDFDVAVLAVPPDIIAGVATGLDGHDSKWDAMRAHSSSVATGAFQLWLYPTLKLLGWELGSTVLTAYAPAFESWADMTHLLPRENPSQAKTIAYFCGTLEAQPRTDRETAMNTWLSANIAVLWPNAAHIVTPSGLDPTIVEAHYCRYNLLGSERYVLTPPGTVKYRLSSSRSLFGNLYVAGDWTLTRFSGGCLESAMESGVLAAAAIQRDHP